MEYMRVSVEYQARKGLVAISAAAARPARRSNSSRPAQYPTGTAARDTNSSSRWVARRAVAKGLHPEVQDDVEGRR